MSGGGGGGGSLEVYGHLHCFQHVKLQVVKTAPDSQLLNLLSVSRLVTVLNEVDQWGVVCKFQELDLVVTRLVDIAVFVMVSPKVQCYHPCSSTFTSVIFPKRYLESMAMRMILHSFTPTESGLN